MNEVLWKKYKAKGFVYFIIVFGLRLGLASALFAIFFKNIGATLIYDEVINFRTILNDIYSTGILFFLLGFPSAYLTWRGYEKQYNN